MEAYLVSTVEKLTSNNYSNLNVVMGNESCDLDSAVSALVYGSFLHWQYLQIKCKVCTRVHRDESVYKDELFVPVLNVDREDYALKTEVKFALDEHNIDSAKLIFRDDHDLKSLLSTARSHVTLVDHHILAKRDRFLTSYVNEIIDHRPIDKSEWQYSDETRTTIEQTGSCCTLVADRIRGLGTLLAKDVDFFNAFPVCTDLLHSGIVLDTVNFSKEVNKATAHDLQVVEFLETVLNPTDALEFRKSKLDRLVEARRNVSNLTAAQLIRKDYKVFGDVLVPSFPIMVEDFLARPEAMKAINDALLRHECNVALLLGMSLDNDLRRDTAVYSPNKNKTDMFARRLTDNKQPPLMLKEQDTSHPGLIYFRQMNLAASRKQYIPIINALIEQTPLRRI